MFAQAHQHGVVQFLPHSGSVPVTKPPPAGHAAAIAQGLRQVFPGDAGVQHEQDAVEGRFVADGTLARSALGRWHEGRDEGLQLSPQFFADRSSCHEGAKHSCSAMGLRRWC